MPLEWLLLGLAALVIGVAKTSFGGLASLAVALLAFLLPTTKEATAATLLLLITGDVVAVLRYRSSTDWKLVRGLLPAVVPGLLLGAWFLSAVDDTILRRSIGGLLLVFVVVQLVDRLRRNRPTDSPDDGPPHRALTIGAGVAAGFTTMAANAAGPVMALYLQWAKVDKMRFLGTGAVYFFIINLAKTPLTAGLGLFTPTVLTTAAALVPVVLLGTLVGIALIGKVPQRAFDIATLVTSAIAAAALIIF